MNITEDCINHYVVALVSEIVETIYDIANDKNMGELYAFMYLASIEGVCTLANRLKEDLKQ